MPVPAEFPAAPAPRPGTARMSRYRWVIVSLLFAAVVVNYMDRQVLGLLEPDYLSKTFHWSALDYGRINIAFQAAYALGQVAFGPLIDWAGSKAAFGVAIAVWSLAAMAHAATRSVFGFGAARFALGLGESGAFPTAIRSIAEWFPPKERSVATGLFNTGTNIGAMVAPVLVPVFAAAFGWRGAFLALGVSGFVWLVFWALFYDAPGKCRRVSASELAHIAAGESPAASARIPWRRLLRYREAWAYYGTCILVGPVWWFYGFWLPDFFSKQFHLDLVHFGPPLVVVYSAAAFGSVGGGGLSAFLMKRGWSLNWARKSSALLCALCTLPVMLTTHVGSVWLATAFFALAAAAHQGWSATMYTVVADIFPKPAVASVVGLGGTLASVMSMGFFWLVSNILQNQGGYGTIMLLCGGAYVVAWTVFQIGVPRITTVEVR